MYFDLALLAAIVLLVGASYWLDRPASPPWTTDISAPSIDAEEMSI